MRSRGFQFRVRIAQRREVRRARARIQILEQAVVPFLRFELRDLTVGIVEIAKHDGIGWAYLLAGGQDLSVTNVAILAFGVDSRLIDPLHAVGALLHDAAAPNAD